MPTQRELYESSESPASQWIADVENPESVVSQYGTTYSGEGEGAKATGIITQPVKRNLDQWGNEIPPTAGQINVFTIPSHYSKEAAKELADIVSPGATITGSTNTLSTLYNRALSNVSNSFKGRWTSYLTGKW